MPRYTPMNEYRLTSTQVDLIIYCLDYATGLTIDEDNEKRKIMDILSHYEPGPYIPSEDPYESYCDI